jgi:very-short-patch-repair endonuclease
MDEHAVRDPVTGRLLAELDLADPVLRIGVECQSWWHGSPGATARDAARKRRLRLLGWELVELWWTDLTRIDEVVKEVEYLIDQRTSPRGAQ